MPSTQLRGPLTVSRQSHFFPLILPTLAVLQSLLSLLSRSIPVRSLVAVPIPTFRVVTQLQVSTY